MTYIGEERRGKERREGEDDKKRGQGRGASVRMCCLKMRDKGTVEEQGYKGEKGK